MLEGKWVVTVRVARTRSGQVRSVQFRREPEVSGPEALSIRDLDVSYGGQRALRGVNLVVPAGACVAILGSNGAGKSTLLHAISGGKRPTSGSIRFGPLRLDRMPAHRISERGVCHVPEGRSVFPDLTVAENLCLFLPGATEREQALDHFPKLRSRLEQRAGTLSGGEQQMLAMAPAVAGSHRLLLVDELSLGLAPIVTDELFDALRRIRRDMGASLIIVEQFADRALEIADLACVLRKGTIAYEGPADDLRQRGDGFLRDLYLGGSVERDHGTEVMTGGRACGR